MYSSSQAWFSKILNMKLIVFIAPGMLFTNLYLTFFTFSWIPSNTSLVFLYILSHRIHVILDSVQYVSQVLGPHAWESPKSDVQGPTQSVINSITF